MSAACSPGEHTHADRPNFTFDDYMQMVRDGEETFSLSEAARLLGVSRMRLHRWMLFAKLPEAEFAALLRERIAAGLSMTDTAIADHVKRRLGRTRTYEERCPCCGYVLRRRER